MKRAINLITNNLVVSVAGKAVVIPPKDSIIVENERQFKKENEVWFSQGYLTFEPVQTETTEEDYSLAEIKEILNYNFFKFKKAIKGIDSVDKLQTMLKFASKAQANEIKARLALLEPTPVIEIKKPEE